ncbi:MAG: DUF3631 domain-containing protein [Mycobacterium sp.]|uniref:DUF3631 domain-containing protein n=1 Tax=Mycobacterium sp. TaxID=1785 RepID=UPI003CC5C81F
MKQLTPDQLLASEVEQIYRQFMYMPNDHSFTVPTLWVMHTHLRSAEGVFLPYITPRLYFGSKTAGCGKSLATKLTTRMSHNGEMILEPTPPSVTTMLNEDLATLGFDEIDTYFGRGSGRDSMRAILNGGYEAGTCVTRQRGDESERMNCHGPVVMNGKNANLFLTSDRFDTLRSRSISIILDEKPPTFYVDRFNPERHNPRLRDLMRRIKRWGLVNAHTVLGVPVDGLMPARIANRAEEIWTVLFQIAAHLGGDWPARCEAAARAFVLGEWEDETPSVSPAEELLACVQATVLDSEGFVPTTTILDRLEDLPQQASIMGEWHSPRAATMGLSRALAVFGIIHVRRTHEGDQVWGYDRGDLGCQPSQPTNLANQSTLCAS